MGYFLLVPDLGLGVVEGVRGFCLKGVACRGLDEDLRSTTEMSEDVLNLAQGGGGLIGHSNERPSSGCLPEKINGVVSGRE